MIKELLKRIIPKSCLNILQHARKIWRAREFIAIINEHNISFVKEGIEKYHAQPWYEYAFADFKNREHAYKSYKWICSQIKTSASILETGCGIGGMLYFLDRKGYKRLYGYDIDVNSINAGNYITNILGINANLVLGDGFNPGDALHDLKFDIIIGISWIYIVPNYSIEIFLKKHIPFLNKNGYIIFDMVDKEYNNEENNKYCTQDWSKPQNERRESEYKLRYSKEEIEKCGKENNLRLIRFIKTQDVIHRNIYIMGKN
jgi:SAM-dependent methyltransferase